MQQIATKPRPRVALVPLSYGSLLLGLAVLLALYVSSLYNYLFFHSLAEVFVIVITGSVFVVAWNSRRFLKNNYLLFVGIAYLYVTGLTVLHMLSYKGMGVFSGDDADLPTQLWLATRYVQSVTLFLAPLMLGRAMKPRLIVAGYAAATALLLASIFVWPVFPVAYIEGEGLTPFKIASEYIVALIFAGSIIQLYRKRQSFDPVVMRLLIWSTLFAIAAGLAFTLYVGVYDLSNLIGHFFAIVSFYLIYLAIIQTGLERPYDLLFRELTQAEQRYRDLFEAAPVEYVIARNGNGGLIVTDCNERFLETMGYEAQEVIGRPLASFFAPEMPSEPGHSDSHSSAEGRLQGREQRLLTRDGQVIETLMRTELEADAAGEHVGVRATFVNITERKRAERALREARDELEQRVRERTAELSRANEALQQQSRRLQVLHAIDKAILAAGLPVNVAQTALHQVRVGTGCQRAAVVFMDEASGEARILAVDTEAETALGPGETVPIEMYQSQLGEEPGRVGRVENLLKHPGLADWARILYSEGMAYYVRLPLIAEGRLIGTLNLWAVAENVFSQETLDFAGQVADSMAVAIQNARLFQEVRLGRERLQDLSRRLVEVQENERRAIARELHDEAGQALTSLKIGLGLLEREGAVSETALVRVHELKESADSIMEGLHRMVMSLRPTSLDRLGLVPAVQQYLETIRRQSDLETEFTTLGMNGQRLPSDVETTVYRVVQEALTNVTRHAHATQVGVILEKRPGRIVAIVEDNGVGFDMESARSSGRMGLLGMRERAEVVGGMLTIESSEGQGTTVFVEIPDDSLH